MRKNTVTLRDMYLDYPNKKYPENENTVPLPYFPKKESTDNEKSLRMHEWVFIMRTYFEIITDYILQGGVFVLPYNLGKIYIKKYKESLFVEKGEHKLFTGGYRISPMWWISPKLGFDYKLLRTWKLKTGKVIRKRMQSYIVKTGQKAFLNYTEK